MKVLCDVHFWHLNGMKRWRKDPADKISWAPEFAAIQNRHCHSLIIRSRSISCRQMTSSQHFSAELGQTENLYWMHVHQGDVSMRPQTLCTFIINFTAVSVNYSFRQYFSSRSYQTCQNYACNNLYQTVLHWEYTRLTDEEMLLIYISYAANMQESTLWRVCQCFAVKAQNSKHGCLEDMMDEWFPMFSESLSSQKASQSHSKSETWPATISLF